ncbi:hypothetical protein [Devosia sp. SD17-2]|uniref:hypothetical protein n=1 Tax=Devosia sp. SD17-2 TaxID=2976459 RepID=UPI0023D859A5|nr:hypothetical protein [Devosia sp. SD17-2]WEJ31981.1 hypothetical protein NYQ88_13840 [Devosia sp. SD17-2]
MTEQKNSHAKADLQRQPGDSRTVEPGITRRALIRAFPMVGAAMAIPVASATAVEENNTRLDRLMQEIAEILDTELMGTFTAVIGPSKEDRPLAMLMPTSDVRKAITLLRTPAPFDLEAWLKRLPAIERANYHQQKLAEALCEASPGKWRTAACQGEGHQFLLVVRDVKTTPENASVFVQQLTDGGAA